MLNLRHRFCASDERVQPSIRSNRLNYDYLSFQHESCTCSFCFDAVKRVFAVARRRRRRQRRLYCV